MANYYGIELEHSRTRAAEELADVEIRLSHTCVEHRTRLDAVAAFVAAAGFQELTESEFNAFARGLTRGRDEVRNVSVAPEGVQRLVYPLEGNESVVGHDLLEDERPEVRSEVKRAIETGRTVSSGPYPLRQGGHGLVIRQAVSRNGEFWGLVALTLDTAAALDAAGLSARIGEFNIGVRSEGEEEPLLGNEQAFSSEAVVREVRVFDRKWELSAYPDGGFRTVIPATFWVIFWLTLVTALITILLVYMVATRQTSLHARLQRRTKDLSEQLRERARTEETLKSEHALLESISQTSPVGIIAMDRQGSVSYANAYTARVLRVPQEDLIHRRFDALRLQLETHDDHQPEPTTLPFREVMEKGCPMFDRRYQVRHGDKVRVISVNAAPIPDSDEAAPVLPVDEDPNEAVPVDHPVGVVQIIKDITDQVESEEHVKRALREKDVLLREIHHRVKNNLNIITSLLSLQQSRIQDAEGAVAAFSDIRNRVHALAQLHQMLYQSENLEVIDLADYIRDAALTLQHNYDPHGLVSVEFSLQAVPSDMDHAIPAGLIFTELFTNALEHGMPEHDDGAIRVALDKDEDDTVTLEVADNGNGIVAESQRPQSTSLGLELVHALTQQLHGNLDVETSDGTRFRLTFALKTR
ncbi:MAG: histidine kinase dimerization/phosphoacceptor domain -containing protein [Spirochaetota bacterium]